jgi:hypothetical protein
MAAMMWEAVARTWCDRLEGEAILLEQRVYAPEMMPGPGPIYRVRARRCSADVACNLAGCPCRWSGIAPGYDPLAEAAWAAPGR